MDSITLNKLYEGLKEITILSTDVEAQEKALKLLLLVHDEKRGFVEVDTFRIPANVYQEAVKEMRNKRKIYAIKVLRNGIRRNNDCIGIKEAKELSERISIIEKIPMNKGYEIPDN